MDNIKLNNFHTASNEMARQINSRLILNLVREYQPISRVELTNRTGLQRSTVSVIAEQLINNQWLREGSRGSSFRGRKPIFLHLNEQRIGVIGINIGLKSTDIGLANLNGNFVVRETMVTAPCFDKFVLAINRRVNKWQYEYPHMEFQEIGICVPGPIDPSNPEYVFGPSSDWNIGNLKKRVEKGTELNVQVECVANACALAELRFHRHLNGTNNILAVHVSEQINIGIILNGQLVRNSHGVGDCGHVIIKENGPKCSCGNYGCWNVYASNEAAISYFNDLRGDKRKVTFEKLLQLASKRDAQALESLKYMAENLGNGLAMLVSGLSPDVVSVAGEIALHWKYVVPIIKESFHRRTRKNARLNIIAGGTQPPAALRGIVAKALQKYFDLLTKN